MAQPKFKFTGSITPEQMRYAKNPTTPISFKIDKAMYDILAKKHKSKSFIADYAQGALDAHLMDLDSVLLATMENNERQRHNNTMTSMAHIDYKRAELLQEAANFLKEKKYARMGRGTIMVACILLRADSEKLLPKD